MAFSRLSALSVFKRVASKVVINSKASRPFATYKTSTGLVGMAVDPNGRETLLNLSNEVLESVSRMPDDAGYRIHVEKWYKYFAKTCTDHQDIKAIEEEIDLGQIEEVILMARDELGLVDYYYDNKGWEIVARERARADEVVASMHDSIYFFEEKRPKAPEGSVGSDAKP